MCMKNASLQRVAILSFEYLIDFVWSTANLSSSMGYKCAKFRLNVSMHEREIHQEKQLLEVGPPCIFDLCNSFRFRSFRTVLRHQSVIHMQIKVVYKHASIQRIIQYSEK